MKAPRLKRKRVRISVAPPADVFSVESLGQGTLTTGAVNHVAHDLLRTAAAQTSRPSQTSKASQASRPSQTSKASQSCGGRVKLQNIWKQLEKLHDKDGDGKITKKEFTRGETQFRNHDRNQDGVISTEDFPEGRWWNGFGPGMARRADRNRDREVSKEEWQAFVKMLDTDGNGIINQKEFGKMAGPQVASKMKILELSFDQDGDGKIEASDFDSHPGHSLQPKWQGIPVGLR